MSRYEQGRHAIVRDSRGRHAVERFPLGAHGIYHPASWYIKRGVAKRSMPAVAVLLTSSLAAGSVSVPLRAVAVDGDAAPSTQTMQLAPEDAVLVFNEETGYLIDIATGDAYDPMTRILIDLDLLPEEARQAIGDAIASMDVSDADILDEPIAPGIDDQIIDELPVIDEAIDGLGVPVEEALPSQEAVLEDLPAQEGADPVASASIESIEAGSIDATATVEATVTELRVASRLLNAGWTPEMVAAALGNMYAESGSNAASYCDMSGMFHYPYEVAAGLFQWTDAGDSPTQLSSAGFTGLSNYAAQLGKSWTDVDVQTDYFLQTWREGWAERQTYYDDLHPDYAGVDVSLASFDESLGGDFDKDGIADAWDDDVDGDGVPNADDPVTLRVEGEVIQRSKAASVARILPMEAAQRTDQETSRHIEELTFAFMAGYEGPAASVAHFDRRAAHALAMYPAVVALDKTRALGVMDSKAGLIVASAEAMLGGRYVWAAESPSTKTFDCSGLTKWCYSLAGVSLAHYSESQYVQASNAYSIAEAVPGDILWKPGHVGIYIGNGRTIEAKGVGYGIVYGDAASFSAALHFDAIDEPVQ